MKHCKFCKKEHPLTEEFWYFWKGQPKACRTRVAAYRKLPKVIAYQKSKNEQYRESGKERETVARYKARNKEKIREYHRQRNILKREEFREKHLVKKYGLTLAKYHELLTLQNSECAICERVDIKLVVDHCHDTGKIRGLLCPQCNAGIGLFKEQPSNLYRAIKYLDEAIQ